MIDDSDGVRSTLKAVLGSSRHDVAVTPDGVDGVGQFRERSFDLVISDIVMPWKDGSQTVRELWEMPEAVPIIVMSGGFQHSDNGDNQRDIGDVLYIAKELGATRMISKPSS